MNNEEIALEAIRKSAGTEQGEYGIDEFISHHIEELPKSYWKGCLGTEVPNPEQVIGLLVLREKWEDEDVYDFTLPGDVTDYVMSVSFGKGGAIEDISMES